MIGPISRPLAPAYLKGIHVPEPPSSNQKPAIPTTASTEPRQAEPADRPKEVEEDSPQTEAETKRQDQEIARLERRDAEVRAHEQAHKAAAGQFARGGASFEFEVGPNGKRYAVGGEVSIDLSQAATPEQTILKAQVVRRAALAPAQPSSQDRKVAAMATAMENAAKAELAQQQQAEAKETTNPEQSRTQASTSSQTGVFGAELIAQRAASVKGAQAYGRQSSAVDREPRSHEIPIERTISKAQPNARPASHFATLDIRM